MSHSTSLKSHTKLFGEGDELLRIWKEEKKNRLSDFNVNFYVKLLLWLPHLFLHTEMSVQCYGAFNYDIDWISVCI